MNDSSFLVDERFPYTIAKTAFNAAYARLTIDTAIDARDNHAEVSITFEITHRQTKLSSDVIGLQN